MEYSVDTMEDIRYLLDEGESEKEEPVVSDGSVTEEKDKEKEEEEEEEVVV